MHAWSARRALPRTFQGQRCAWSPSCCSRITMAHCERNTPRASGYSTSAFLLGCLLAPRPRVAHLMNFVAVEEAHLCNRRLKKFSFRRKTVKRKEAGAPELATGARRSRRSLHDRSPVTFRFKNTGGSRDTHGTHGHTDHTDEPHNHPDPPTATHTHDRGADDPRTDRSTEPHGRLPSEPAALCTVTAVDRIAATPDGLFFP